MNWINYLLEANLYMVLFYAAYYLLLRRDTHYQLNRIYLIVSTLLAFIIPVMKVGVLKPAPIVIQAAQVSIPYPQALNSIVIPQPAEVHTVAINYYVLIYFICALIMTAAFGIRIYQLIKMARRGNKIFDKDYRVIEIEDDDRAFSFFSYLFISKKLTTSATIIQHELVHIRQKHSLDIMYFELVKIICWFNPVVYLMQNSIKEVHEFIADNHIAANQHDVNHYTDFLISNAYGLPEMAMANNFFNKNLLKNRIIMLHQKRSGSLARLKYLVALPLLAGMLCLSTLGFTKDYSFIDLIPAKAVSVTSNNPFDNLANYLKDNIKYTKAGLDPRTRKDAHTGSVMAGFTLNKAGKLQNVKIISGATTLLERDVIKALSTYPDAIDYTADKYYLGIDLDDKAGNVKSVIVYDMLYRPKGISQFTQTHPAPDAITPPPPPAPGMQDIKHKMPPPPPPVPPFKKQFGGLANHVGSTVRYTKSALDKGITGVVALSFNLNTEGKIEDIKVAQSTGYGLDEAVIQSVLSYKDKIFDKPGTYFMAVDFLIMKKQKMPAVQPSIAKNNAFIGELIIGDVPPPKPKVDQVRFPPPVVKPDGAPHKPKVDQIRFPPPVVVPDKPVYDTVAQALFQPFYLYLGRHIRYPRVAVENLQHGKVFVIFNVDENNKPYNFFIARGLSAITNNEVLRVLANATLPANSRKNVNYTIPISFNIQDKSGKWAEDKDYSYAEATPPINKEHKQLGYKTNIALNEVVVVGFNSVK
jgi:TonB family protein